MFKKNSNSSMTTNPNQTSSLTYHSALDNYQSISQDSSENQQPGLAQNSAIEHKRRWKFDREENYKLLNKSEEALETEGLDIPLPRGISNQSKTIQKKEKELQFRHLHTFLQK